jgi:hypothetical protein
MPLPHLYSLLLNFPHEIFSQIEKAPAIRDTSPSDMSVWLDERAPAVTPTTGKREAAGEGFEPSLTDPESIMLPLHNPVVCGRVFRFLTALASSLVLTAI